MKIEIFNPYLASAITSTEKYQDYVKLGLQCSQCFRKKRPCLTVIQIEIFFFRSLVTYLIHTGYLSYSLCHQIAGKGC